MHRMYEEELQRLMNARKTKTIDRMENEKEVADMVNHPPHYTEGYKEVIEMMEDIFGSENLATYCIINAFKYRMRAGKKNDVMEDIKKAEWYEAKAKELKGSPVYYKYSISDGWGDEFGL